MAPKVKMTPTGPTVVSGENEPKLKASAEDIQSAALDFLKQNTAAPKEEVKTEEPAAPAQSTEEFLGSLKERGVNDQRINKKLKFLTGDTRPHFDAMADTVTDFQAAHDDLKSKMQGLVYTDKDLNQIDEAGDFHKHIGNLLNQAQRHLSAAALKEQDGRRGSSVQNVSNLLARKTGTRIRQEDLTGGSDTLERYAPIDAGQTGDRPPAEDESIKFLNEYTDNDFLKQAENFEAMGSADHVEHARNLLAGVAQAIPQALQDIHRTPKLKKQMANAGKMAPLPAEATRTFNKLMGKFMGPAQSYLDYAAANPGKDEPKKGPTIYDAFGLDHHLKRLTALRNSSALQQSIGSQLDLVSKVYKERYSKLLDKYAAGRGHVISTTLEPVKTSSEDESMLNSVHSSAVSSLTAAGTGAKALHDSLLARNERILTPDLYGLTKNRVKYNFNEDGSYKDSNINEVLLKGRVEALSDRVSSLQEVGKSHPQNSRWAPLLDKASKLNSSFGDIDRAHKLLDAAQRSMEKNGISVRSTEEVRAKNPSTIPTLEQFASTARVGEPIRETSLEKSGGIADPRVDLSWGGTEDPSVGKTTYTDPYAPSWLRGRKTRQVMNPSVQGFHIPSEDARQQNINISQREAAAAKKAAGRKAEMDAAAAKSKEVNWDSMRPWSSDPGFFGGGIAPIDFNEKPRDTELVDETGLLRPSANLSFNSRKAQEEEDTAADAAQVGESKPVEEPRAKKTRVSKAKQLETAINDVSDSMAPGTAPETTAAERAAAMFSDRRR